MFILKAFLFIFVCLLAVCGTSVSQTENANQTQTKQKPELSIKMERSGCYGRCAIYDLTIEPDGKVIFDGKSYTQTIGKAEDKLSEAQLKQLVNEIEKADFFSFDNAYDYDSNNCPTVATDSPGVNLTIKLNGKEKKINHYHGCIEKYSANQSKDWSERIFPQQLYKLETKIDEIAGTKRWIGDRK